jgi:hypothetical protein
VLAKSLILVWDAYQDGSLFAFGMKGKGGRLTILLTRNGVFRVYGEKHLTVLGIKYTIRVGEEFADVDDAKAYARSVVHGEDDCLPTFSKTLRGLVPVREKSRALPVEAA